MIISYLGGFQMLMCEWVLYRSGGDRRSVRGLKRDWDAGTQFVPRKPSLVLHIFDAIDTVSGLSHA